MPDAAHGAEPTEIILEMRVIGPALEVTAVDVASGIEVRFQAPCNAPTEALRQLAQQKLRYVSARQTRRALPAGGGGRTV